MPKEYRKRRGSRASKSNTSHGFAWAVFGILVGLFLAIVIYWQLAPSNSHSDVNKSQTHASAKTAKTTTHTHSAVTSKKPAAPEFDFYTVLPKMQVAPNSSTPVKAQAERPVMPVNTPVAPPSTPSVIPNSVTTPAVPPETVSPDKQVVLPSTPDAAPPTAPSTTLLPPASSKKTSIPKDQEHANYLLQMASLKNYADADRLKAQLTMLGFDVYIVPYKGNGQIYNRVVMGPYSSRSAAVQQQTLLQKRHVPSILIRTR